MHFDFIPYCKQIIDNDDLAAVERALKGNFLTNGPEVQAFEKELATYVNATHAVSCSSGTAALHLICLALGLKPGDQVIYIGGHLPEYRSLFDKCVGSSYTIVSVLDAFQIPKDARHITHYELSPELPRWDLKVMTAAPRTSLMKIDPDQGIKEEVNEIINKIPKEILTT